MSTRWNEVNDADSGRRRSRWPFGMVSTGITVILFLGSCFLFFVAKDFFGYMFYRVGENEIGVILDESRVVDVVGPGIYSDPFNMWADIVPVKIEGVGFVVIDPEVLTKDKQRIGLTVSGTIHRPGVDKQQTYFDLWAQYKSIFIDDEALAGPLQEDSNRKGGRVESLALQAMKVCVGDRDFNDAVVGAARDVLRECIDGELDSLVESFGMVIQNLTVPNVALLPEAQAQLDAITKSRLETERERQDALRAKAKADREQAEQEGIIRVEQSRIQEQLRQEKISADLEQQQIQAQLAVIQAQKANELSQAELGKAVAEAELQVALVKAKIDVAEQMALAELFQQNPAYAEFRNAQVWAGAWGPTDKVIVPVGTNVTSVLNPSDDSITTVVDTNK